MVTLPDLDSRSPYLLQRAVERSKRSAGIQLPLAFVRAEPRSSSATPLARMLRGGRGGEVRLKLYLSITLVATHPPYDIKRPIPARAWAEMLALPDFEQLGARRVSDALTWLSAQRFIKLRRHAG